MMRSAGRYSKGFGLGGSLKGQTDQMIFTKVRKMTKEDGVLIIGEYLKFILCLKPRPTMSSVVFAFVKAKWMIFTAIAVPCPSAEPTKPTRLPIAQFLSSGVWRLHDACHSCQERLGVLQCDIQLLLD